MAELVVSPLLRVLFQSLASPLVKEFGLLWGVNEELDKLSETLLMIQVFLEDADRKRNQDEAVSIWLARLEDAALDVDDILDEFATKAKLQNIVAGRQSVIRNKVQRLLSSLKPSRLRFQYHVAHRTQKIIKRLEAIHKDTANYRLRECHGEIVDGVKQPTGSSFITESKIFGRQTEKEEIVLWLLANCPWSTSSLSVLPIVGIGGLGKTTLAQLVYNDTRLETHFDLRIWVCASDNFDVTRLIKAIMESTLRTCELMELDALQKALVGILVGKKFLLVLDDVWDESNHGREHWYALRMALSRGAPGSTVIVTTRSNIVASNMTTVQPYYLRPMSEEDCLLVFNQCFNPDAYPTLVKIGRQIVQKCHGLPLAAKTLGCLLNSKVDENEWNIILKSETWNSHSKEDRNGILPALKLSYQHLPSHLKRCFAYCSLFPKDYIFNREKLVQLWLAEGFVHPEGSRPIESTAQSYFDGLLSRSFFQYSYSYQHQLFVYTMHDLIQDLAQSISGDGYFRMQGANVDNVPKKTRHLSICDKLEGQMLKAVVRSEKLRTFLLLHERAGWFESVPSEMFDKLKCLRVLGLNKLFQVRKLPSSIGDMNRLQYLDLSYNSFRYLPTSICNLCNLQVLILRHTDIQQLPKHIGNLVNLGHFDLSCSRLKRLPKSFENLVSLQYLNLSGPKLKELPQSFGNLVNLTYLNLSYTRLSRLPASISNLYDLQTLDISACSVCELPDQTGNLVNLQHLRVSSYQLTSMPPGIGRLASLQTLPVFIVGKDVACGLGQLSAMNNLQGKLCILKLENAVNLEESNMKNKLHVSDLSLQWSSDHDASQDGEAALQVLQGLEPCTNLKFLHIEYYEGTQFPGWLGDPSFSCLATVTLSYCKKLSSLPSLGQLPSLRRLHIRELNGVRCIRREFYGDGVVKGFPSLTELNVDRMQNLEEWSGMEENEFPQLPAISISYCNKLKNLPYLPPSVKALQLSGCEGLQALPVLPNLKGLRVASFKGAILNSLPQLTSLESLEICDPHRLDSLQSLQPLQALKWLSLQYCDELCAQSEWDGLQNLVSLKYLAIERFRNQTHLPEGGWPTTIEVLRLEDGTDLQALPEALKTLTSLRKIEISYCPQVRCLPEEGLPQTVTQLCIKQCPLLARRCREKKGEDWCKIQHIPSIEISD